MFSVEPKEFRKPRESGGLSVAVLGPVSAAAADTDLELTAVVTVCNATAAANASSHVLGVSQQDIKSNNPRLKTIVTF
jgi:hypothetical protein